MHLEIEDCEDCGPEDYIVHFKTLDNGVMVFLNGDTPEAATQTAEALCRAVALREAVTAYALGLADTDACAALLGLCGTPYTPAEPTPPFQRYVYSLAPETQEDQKEPEAMQDAPECPESNAATEGAAEDVKAAGNAKAGSAARTVPAERIIQTVPRKPQPKTMAEAHALNRKAGG